MNFNVIRVILGASVLILSLAPDAGADRLSMRVKTMKARLRVSIHYRPAMKSWAEYNLAQAQRFIVAAERYLKVPFPYRDYITIRGCDNCQSQRRGRKVDLDYAVGPQGDPALVMHELGHYWFWYPSGGSCLEWFIEGAASFLPTMLRENRNLPDEPQYRAGVNEHWGLYTRLASDIADLPLCPVTINEQTRRVLYTKTYRLQYLLRCTLGAREWRRLVRKVALNHPQTSSQIEEWLKESKSLDWEKFLAGWVWGNAYAEVALSDFNTDSDADGLVKADEYCAATLDSITDMDGDGLPDGAEAALGTDPKFADDDASTLLKANGPFVDGNDVEWRYFETRQLAYEPAGDSGGGGAGLDMVVLSWLIKDQKLYLLVKTEGVPESPLNTFFDVLVDTNGDSFTDEEFAFMLNDPQTAWRYSPLTGKVTWPAGLKAALGAVFEMVIPLAEIGVSQFRILPIIRHDLFKLNHDEWKSWVAVNTMEDVAAPPAP